MSNRSKTAGIIAQKSYLNATVDVIEDRMLGQTA